MYSLEVNNMPYLKLEQVNLPLYYELQGSPDVEQPLIVFVNGWCLSGRYWAKTNQLIPFKFQTLIYDSPGFGRSLDGERVIPADYHISIEREVEILATLIEKFGFGQRQIQVVGHSLGALIAARYALQLDKENKLAGLTIINSGSLGPEEKGGDSLIPFVKIFVKAKSFFGLPGLRQAVVSRSVGLPIGTEYAQIIVDDIVNSDKRLALELSLSSLEQINLNRYREELLAIKARILLIVGDKDKTIPPKGMYNIKSFKPESELVPFPNCGHLPMLEQPERFARVLMEHFALVGSEGVVLP